VVVIRRQVEVAVIQKRETNRNQREEEQRTGRDDAALHQLRTYGSEHGDDKGSRTQHQSSIGGAVAIKRLQQLRNHGRRAEEPKAEKKVQKGCDGKIAASKQVQINDGIFLPQLPHNRRHQARYGDAQGPADERGPEPVVDLAAIQRDFERGRPYPDQRNANPIDPQLSRDTGRAAFLLKLRRVMHKAVGKKE